MNKIRLSYQVVIVVHHITAFVLIGRKIPCLQSGNELSKYIHSFSSISSFQSSQTSPSVAHAMIKNIKVYTKSQKDISRSLCGPSSLVRER